jgi:hypothetical protein
VKRGSKPRLLNPFKSEAVNSQIPVRKDMPSDFVKSLSEPIAAVNIAALLPGSY